MPDLKTRFRDADRVPVPDLWRQIEDRAAAETEARVAPWDNTEPRKWPHLERVVAAAAAITLAAVAIGVLARVFRDHGTPGSTTHGRLVSAIRVGDQPTDVAVGLGSVWVANAGDGTISKVDPRTNRVISTIPVAAGKNDLVGGVAVGAGSVWAMIGVDPRVGPGRIVRIDPRTGKITAQIGVPYPLDIGFAFGSAWVVDNGYPPSRGESGRVYRIDPKTDSVTTIVTGGSPWQLAFTHRTVWVLGNGPNDALAWAIDPMTNKTTTKVDLTAPRKYVWDVGAFATSGTTAWTQICTSTAPPPGKFDPPSSATCKRWLVGIDDGAGEVSHRLPSATGVFLVSSDAHGIWALTGAGRLGRIDPSTGKTRSNEPLGQAGTGGVFQGATGEGGLWITNYSRDLVLHIRSNI